MIRGTTPTHTFNIPFEAGMIKECRIIYAQDNEVIVKKDNSKCILEGTTIKVTLTQEDTFKFDNLKPVQIQLRILTKSGEVFASIVENVGVSKCLDNEVLV